MIDENIAKCKICNSKMEYLDHEIISLPIYHEGAVIGGQKNVPAVNINFYCDRCQCNRSEAFPYKDEEIIPRFIEDVKKYSVKFEKRRYINVN
jgi:hypothetical protein